MGILTSDQFLFIAVDRGILVWAIATSHHMFFKSVWQQIRGFFLFEKFPSKNCFVFSLWIRLKFPGTVSPSSCFSWNKERESKSFSLANSIITGIFNKWMLSSDSSSVGVLKLELLSLAKRRLFYVPVSTFRLKPATTTPSTSHKHYESAIFL